MASISELGNYMKNQGLTDQLVTNKIKEKDRFFVNKHINNLINEGILKTVVNNPKQNLKLVTEFDELSVRSKFPDVVSQYALYAERFERLLAKFTGVDNTVFESALVKFHSTLSINLIIHQLITMTNDGTLIKISDMAVSIVDKFLTYAETNSTVKMNVFAYAIGDPFGVATVIINSGESNWFSLFEKACEAWQRGSTFHSKTQDGVFSLNSIIGSSYDACGGAKLYLSSSNSYYSLLKKYYPELVTNHVSLADTFDFWLDPNLDGRPFALENDAYFSYSETLRRVNLAREAWVSIGNKIGGGPAVDLSNHLKLAQEIDDILGSLVGYAEDARNSSNQVLPWSAITQVTNHLYSEAMLKNVLQWAGLSVSNNQYGSVQMPVLDQDSSTGNRETTDFNALTMYKRGANVCINICLQLLLQGLTQANINTMLTECTNIIKYYVSRGKYAYSTWDGNHQQNAGGRTMRSTLYDTVLTCDVSMDVDGNWSYTKSLIGNNTSERLMFDHTYYNLRKRIDLVTFLTDLKVEKPQARVIDLYHSNLGFSEYIKNFKGYNEIINALNHILGEIQSLIIIIDQILSIISGI